MQIFSPIKQRILLFVSGLKISKREFYNKTGISRGTLDNSAGITEDTLAKLLAIYGEINSHWLLTGDGDMLTANTERPAPADTPPSASEAISIYKGLLSEREARIERLSRRIGSLEHEVEQLKRGTTRPDQSLAAEPPGKYLRRR